MSPFASLLVVVALFGTVLGLPFGLYALLTRGRRRAIGQIRREASLRGWQFGVRRWQGNPSAFRIRGRSSSGLDWILTSGGAADANQGWSVLLAVRVPALAGEMDLAILPRDAAGAAAQVLRAGLSHEFQDRIASVSGTLANAIGFSESAQEVPSGFSDFDAAYKVLILPTRIERSPINAERARRLLNWPPDALSPHSILIWRDSFGLHVQARLRATPTWPTISYLVGLVEQLCAQLPASATRPEPKGVVDRLAASFFEP